MKNGNNETASDRLKNFLYVVETGLSALKICKKEIAEEIDGAEGAALTLQKIITQMEKECRNVQQFLNLTAKTDDEFMDDLPDQNRFGEILPFSMK
ncbi:MAG: hypothetical protein WA081_19595 [Desulfosalsimonadaceae bacterium]